MGKHLNPLLIDFNLGECRNRDEVYAVLAKYSEFYNRERRAKAHETRDEPKMSTPENENSQKKEKMSTFENAEAEKILEMSTSKRLVN